jgi:hypothetical protein
MRLSVKAVIFLSLACVGFGPAAPDPDAANAAFVRLASLAGRWQGTRYDGKPVRALYEAMRKW